MQKTGGSFGGGGGGGGGGGRGGLVLRVRTQLGVWKLEGVLVDDTFGHLRDRLASEHRTDLTGRMLTMDQAGAVPYPDDQSVAEAGLVHGTMIYLKVDETKTGVHEASSSATARRITKEGNIVAQDHASVANRSGFRPGMLPLRDMKMQWTLQEFVSLDESFEYKLKQQEKAFARIVSIDNAVANNFTSYCSLFDFQRMRVGYLYGTFTEDLGVKVQYIYEPPQHNTDTSFDIAEFDEKAEAVEAITAMLGMKKVGWIFAHPTREKGFFFTAKEVIETAEQQILAAKGVEETSFVTVRVTMTEESEIQVDAWQVSKQCMEMAAEGVLQVSPDNLGACGVNPTFTAFVEGKPTREIVSQFFLNVVPVERFTSDDFLCEFPKANRESDGEVQTREDLKKQVSKNNKEGWTMSALLADFHLLLFLSQFFSLDSDLPSLCRSIMDREVPIEEGHMLVIRSLAGMD